MKREKEKRKKKQKKQAERESLEILASGCPERQDSQGELSCVMSVTSGCRGPPFFWVFKLREQSHGFQKLFRGTSLYILYLLNNFATVAPNENKNKKISKIIFQF